MDPGKHVNDRRVLVTGAAGFVGRYVIAALEDQGLSAAGLGRETRPDWLPHDVEWFQADLMREESLSSVPRGWWGLVHLAGATVPSLFRSKEPLIENVVITLNVLERLQPRRTLLASSCHVYAASSRKLTETSPTQPRGYYGLSKHLTEQVGLAMQERCDVRVARPFNHVGPGMREELAIPSLLRRLAEEGDSQAPLRMLGRNSTRDFVDVRDVARAYAMILARDEPGSRIFNVCTGLPCTIEQLARAVMRILGIQREIVFEQSSGSRDDADFLVGDPSRIEAELGWAPGFGLEESLRYAIRGVAQ